MIRLEEVARYIQEEYYPKYPDMPKELIPDTPMLLCALDLHKDKIVVIVEEDVIRGVAIYLTLSDDTFNKIESFDISNPDVLGQLLQEKGPNLHFILLAASGLDVIMAGIRRTKELKPKTVSWWNPKMTYFHKYNLN